MSFLESLGLEPVSSVENAHGSIYPEKKRARATTILEIYQEPKTLQFHRVFLIYNNDAELDSSDWYDVALDSEGDPSISFSLDQELLDDTDFYMVVDGGTPTIINARDITVDSDGDIQIKFTTTSSKPMLRLRKVDTPNVIEPLWTLGKLRYTLSQGFTIFDGVKHIATHIVPDDEYEDSCWYEFY